MQQSPPISGANLTGMLQDFWHALETSPVLTAVNVKKTGDPNQIIAASCVAVAPAQAAEVAAELERLWTQQLCYQPSEVHTLSVCSDKVVLEGITTLDESSYFVTAQITVRIDPSQEDRGALL